MSDRQGIEIDYCPKCRGVWLDRGELDKIIERSAGVGAAPQPSRPADRDDYRRDDYGRDDRRDAGRDDRYDRDRDRYDRDYDDDRRRYRKRRSFLEDLFDFD